MLDKIDHVAIAVQSLEEVGALLTVLGASFVGEETVSDQHVDVAFYELGGARIELIKPREQAEHLARFLGDKKAALHHIAFRSDDIEQELERLQGLGFRCVDATPRPGAHGCRVAFLHPKSTCDILVELCQ